MNIYKIVLEWEKIILKMIKFCCDWNLLLYLLNFLIWIRGFINGKVYIFLGLGMLLKFWILLELKFEMFGGFLSGLLLNLIFLMVLEFCKEGVDDFNVVNKVFL